MTFFDRLRERIRTTGGVLAVGLNPESARLPADSSDHDYPLRAFNRRIVDATHDHAAAYVLNPAFYADSAGWVSLAETVAYAQGRGVPVVLDGKWNELSNSRADLLDSVDAVTVSPYLGRDALGDLLDSDGADDDSSDLGVFVTCRTPNAGAGDLLDCELAPSEAESLFADGGVSGEDDGGENGDGNNDDGDGDEEDEKPTLAGGIAPFADSWAEDSAADVGLLVGGDPDRVGAIRERAPDLPLLVVGGVRNDPEVAEFAEPESGPNEEVGLVAVSREVAYAGESAGSAGGHRRAGGAGGQDRYATAARQAARRLKGQLNRYR
jgi:orotidine-5'-phosphate decarboxylase